VPCPKVGTQGTSVEQIIFTAWGVKRAKDENRQNIGLG
jgi:hypothetical protein